MKLFPLKKSILSLITIGILSCSSVKTATVSGTVSAIQKGKDGYTATIENAKSVIYYATISISNLGSAEKFREFKIGENVTLFGEIWKMGDDNRITVRKILD